MKTPRTSDWEELAAREPYFPVLTSEGLLETGGSSTATSEFFATGEADISSLLEAMASLLGREIALDTSLDFGCGPGRLTIPLARRALRLVACDISPTLIEHARHNGVSAGLRNIEFIQTGDLAGLRHGQFDFICSLLVFDHIPPTVGYEILRTLLCLLAPTGVAALHITFAQSREGLRRFAGIARRTSRFVHHLNGIAPHGNFRLRAPQVKGYEEERLLRVTHEAGATVVGKFTLLQNHTPSAILILRRTPPSVRPA